MPEPVKFYFDFSSPYSYFASFKIDETCEGLGREVSWRPFLLGALFKITGAQPLNTVPMKGEYCENDWQRLGRYMNVPWTMPEAFPIATQATARTFYWLHDQDPALAKKFAKEAFMTYFGRGQDISSVDAVAELAAPLGVDHAALQAALSDDKIKQRLKDETQSAIDVGVFGAPYFIVDGEGIWGSDRMWMIRRWIERGGW
jgi:2-hydroxychromene-2-carboxylate isomerase